MALTMWGQVIIQAATPGEDPVQVGTVWIDTSGTPTLKVCTAISPYTFAAISSGSVALDDITDVVITAAATGDYLRYNGSNWVDVAASQLATDLAGNFAALVHATRHQNGGADEISVAGLSGLLADDQNPTAHASDHQAGGGDPIALDTLAAPTDITTLDASTTLHGLAPKAVAPAAGLLSALGIGNGETAYTNKPLFDTTNPAALGAVGPGTQVIAARRDHIHANPAIDTLAAATDITTLDSSTTAHGLLVKGVAPAAGIQSVPAIRNGETAYVVRELFDSTNPAALGTAAPGTSLIAARRDHVHAPSTFIAPRIGGTTSSATPTPDADTTDLYDLTALAEAAAFGAPTGTPVNGQKLIIRIKDNATARALTWDAAYVAGGVSLPSTTVLSKIVTLGFIYNTANTLNKWQLVASAQEA